MTPPVVLPPIPLPSALMIQSLAPLLMIGGITVVIFALGPVQRAVRRMLAPRRVVVVDREASKPKTELDRFDIDTLYTD